jgi:ribonuclease HI
MNYSLYFDGASKGNPGKSGSAAVLYQGEKEIANVGKYIGPRKTNNEAEYMGLIFGLILSIQMRIKNVKVYGDSQLIIKQMRGEYAVKNERLKKIYDDIQKLLPEFESISFEHVRREKNARADQLANEAVAKL